MVQNAGLAMTMTVGLPDWDGVGDADLVEVGVLQGSGGQLFDGVCSEGLAVAGGCGRSVVGGDRLLGDFEAQFGAQGVGVFVEDGYVQTPIAGHIEVHLGGVEAACAEREGSEEGDGGVAHLAFGGAVGVVVRGERGDWGAHEGPFQM